MHRRTFIFKTGAAGLVAFLNTGNLLAESPAPSLSELEKRFADPLLSDHPMVYWFWMNGHVTKEGITLDLEAMKRVGISGVCNFDAGISIPKGPIALFSAEWMELKQHAVKEAVRLGLEFVLHNCPGWSASGGPWITPELSMQQVTWSEVVVNGGQPVELLLPIPFHKLHFYRDAAVLAYPSLPSEKALGDFLVFTNRGAVDKTIVTVESDGVIIQPITESEPAWLLFRFKNPHPVHFLTFEITAGDTGDTEDGRTSIDLQTSDDGLVFSTIATISTGMASELATGNKFITYDIPPVKAAYFRFLSTKARRFSQVRFSGYQRLQNFMEKTGNRYMFSGKDTSPVYTDVVQESKDDSMLQIASVIDLTDFVDEKGNLHWQAPEGSWTILRFGHTTTGAMNKAAPENGIGLECDKFNPSAIDFHFDQMMRYVGAALQEAAGMGKVGLLIDSFEAGPQTWTAAFPVEFQKRRGYSLRPYLLALTGRMLNTVHHTEQFLWDYRRTQADLVAESYYGRFAERCCQAGFTAYAEPYDKGPFEEAQVGARVDVGMGEFWYGLHSLLQGNLAVERTSKLAASIMNTNGKNLVGAEAFTSEPASSRWQEYPFSLKALGDKMFCKGVNKMIIHRFVHQPNSFARPGMTMGPWGIHFDRTNTWFEQAGGWLRYNARCQALLRQGLPVKDLAYFTGEEANIYTRVLPGDMFPSPPAGFDYDLVNAETILQKLSIKNGRLFLPNGMQYKALLLQKFKQLTLPLLQKLHQLVKEGMVLVGERPVGPLGLGPAADSEAFEQVVEALWPSSITLSGQHQVGKGKVLLGKAFQTVFKSLALQPDFTYTSRSGDAPLLYTHRKTADTDIYFVCNQRRSFEDVVCAFRVGQKQPEIWDATTGMVLPAPVYTTVGGITQVPLQLDPYGSVFVIFRHKNSKPGINAVSNGNKILIEAKPFIRRPRKLYRDTKNDFTIVLWAKPEMACMLRTSIHMGDVAQPYTDYYAVYPISGKQFYGAGHATCGLAIGRNGVAVWESESYPVLSLAVETPIAGWTHVALVYEKGKPAVFVNGNLVKKGQQRFAFVHPSLGEAFLEEGASYYNGDMSQPVLYKRILTPEMIRQLAKKLPQQGTEMARLPRFVLVQQKPFLLAWQKGTYRLLLSNGVVQSFLVKEKLPNREIKNDWQVRFPQGSGAPDVIFLPALISLHQHVADSVKHFSGTAVYLNNFTVPQAYKRGRRRLFLDLGRVEVIAQVLVNGIEIGVLWKRPFLVDISEAVKTGLNTLEIRVTNLWPNRLIGDESLPDPDRFSTAGGSGFEHLAGSGFESEIGNSLLQMPAWYVAGKPQPANGRIGFATWKHYSQNDPLLESGLIGPVILRSAEAIAIEQDVRTPDR